MGFGEKLTTEEELHILYGVVMVHENFLNKLKGWVYSKKDPTLNILDAEEDIKKLLREMEKDFNEMEKHLIKEEQANVL